MKLFNGFAPNGARVSIFMQEKGIDLPVQNIDVLSGETRSEDYLKINPLGEVPALQLDDGQVITESVAICRYLERLYPTPSLLGATAADEARIEMWNRRIELRLMNVIGDVGLHEFEFFKDRVEQFPAYAEARRRKFSENLHWFEEQLADGRAFIAGDDFSIADITGMAMLMISHFTRFDIPVTLKHVTHWKNKVQSRPSWPQLPS